MSLASLIKRLQDIMRKDSGVDGDAQRLAQIVWLIFLKVYDYKEEEAELDDDYVPVIPKGYRWRDWAVGTSVKEQMTGPDLTSITEIVMPVFARKDTGSNTVYIDATYSIDPQARTATPIVNSQ
jgi:type I restriction-modification system, M subunit